jgi:catechol 2,3-dioxygenase-like lactoylglutathione lyase family enzyme
VGQREFRCNRLGMYYNLTVVRIFSPSLGGAPVNRQYLGAWHRVAPRVSTLSLLLLAASAIESIGAPTPSILWNQSFGSSSKDLGTGISLDGSGNLYITGITTGNLGGPNAGGEDSFVRKYDTNGNALWTRQLGTSTNDDSVAVSADKLGNVFFTGGTSGALGGASAGRDDVFVGNYDSAGNLQWLHQFGTASVDGGLDLSADGQGNVYVGGETNMNPNFPYPFDAFLTKYDSAGNQLWTRTLASTGDDRTLGVSVDGLGNVYAAGWAGGNFSGEPNPTGAFLAKYDAAGNLLWIRQDNAGTIYGMSADGQGNIFLGGTNGDALVFKYDSSGHLIWSRQFGTTGYDIIYALSADQLGNVYVTGSTEGTLGGPNAGSTDTFVAKYDAAGNQLWLLQLGGSGGDSASGAAAGGNGIVYIAGTTGDGGRGSQLGDAFVAKFSDIPEPTTTINVIMLVSLLGFTRSRILSRTVAAW